MCYKLYFLLTNSLSMHLHYAGGSTRSERNAAVKVAEDRVLNSVNPKNPHFMTTIKPYRPHELVSLSLL